MGQGVWDVAYISLQVGLHGLVIYLAGILDELLVPLLRLRLQILWDGADIKAGPELLQQSHKNPFGRRLRKTSQVQW